VRIRSVFSHSAQVIVEGALIATLAIGLVAGSALAAKPTAGGTGGGKHGGGSGGTGTISLASPLVVDNNGNGTPNWGDFVSFNVSTTATTQPWVNLVCSQNGVVVAQGWDGYFDGSITGTKFGLYSSAWTSGAADCVAYLTTPTWTRLGSTSFHVDG
jgi:hypothetical protein